jgi:hypothetical protein
MCRMGVGLVLVMFGMLFSPVTGFAGEKSRAYREVPAVCLPCGAAGYLAIASRSALEQAHFDLTEKCGDPREPATWRQKVDQAGIDFDREALIIMYEVIGTGGKATLDVEGPLDGVLKAAINWNTPKGPAVPIATAACFSFAVDKSMVKRVDVRKGGVLYHHLPSTVPLDISR